MADGESPARAPPQWQRGLTDTELSFVIPELVAPPPFAEPDSAPTGTPTAATACAAQRVVKPRTVNIQKGTDGFGFTLAGVRPVRLSAVEERGAAYQAGARPQDRVLAINGVNVLLTSHQDVVDRICSCEDGVVSLVVLAECPEPQALPSLGRTVARTGHYDELGFELEEYDAKPSPWKHRSKSMMRLEAGFGDDVGDDGAEGGRGEAPSTSSGGLHPASDGGKADLNRDSGVCADGPEAAQTAARALPPPAPVSEAQMRQWRHFLARGNSVQESLWVVPAAATAGVNLMELPAAPVPPQLVDDLEVLLVKGIPHPLRRQVWIRCCNAQAQATYTHLRYDELYRVSREDSSNECRAQIEKDLMRTFPNNCLFNEMDAEGAHRLRRVLTAFSWLYPDIGYCQGMGMVAAWLLLIVREEEAFWCLSAITRSLLPEGYYSHSMIGLMTDQRVLRDLVEKQLPDVGALLTRHNIEMSLICVNWFLTVFATVAPPRTTLRIWDSFLHEGALTLFKVSLAMLNMRRTLLLSLDDSASIFYALSDTPATMTDPDELMKLAYSYIDIEADVAIRRQVHRKALENEMAVLEHRRAAKGMGSNGSAEGGEAAGKPALAGTAAKTGSFMQRIFRSSAQRPVRTTQNRYSEEEMAKIVRLSDAIHSIVLHFENVGAANGDVHSPSRAKQMLGELSDAGPPTPTGSPAQARASPGRDPAAASGSLRGGEQPNPEFLLPAEPTSSGRPRSHTQTSAAGDEAMFPSLRELVHGRLAQAIRAVLNHKLAGAEHCWDFVEACSVDVDGDEGKFITILGVADSWQITDEKRRAQAGIVTAVKGVIKCVARSEIPDDKDAMFRSWLCQALNLNALERWVEYLSDAATSSAFEQMYHEDSFIRTPIWHQIQFELRALSTLEFQLRVEPCVEPDE